MADFRINVIVDPGPARNGIRQVNRSLVQTETLAERTGRTLGRLFTFLGVSAGISQLTSLIDSFTVLENRVRIANNDLQEVNRTIDQIFSIANTARVPVDQLTNLYQRLSVASGELRASQDEVFDVIEIVSQGLALQGGTVVGNASAILQLSQAFSNANVQLQEFNPLMDTAFPILQAAARGIDEAGGSVARLRSLVAQGSITNREFFDAIRAGSDEIRRLFPETTATISQSLTVLRNNLIRSIGELNDLDLAAQALLVLANNLDIVGRAAISAGVALGINFAANVDLASTAIGRLTRFIRLNPLSVLVTAVAAAIGVLIGFNDQISFSTEGVGTLGDAAAVAFQDLQSIAERTAEGAISAYSLLAPQIGMALAPIAPIAQRIFNALPETIQESISRITLSFEGILRVIAVTLDGVVSLMIGTFSAVQVIWENLPDLFSAIGRASVNNLTSLFETAINTILAALQPVVDLINTGLEGVNRLTGTNLSVSITPEISLDRLEGEAITDVGARIGQDIASGVATAFEVGTVATDAVDRFAARVQETGQQRITDDAAAQAAQAAEAARQRAALVAGQGTGSAPVNPELTAILQRFNNAQERSIELSRLTGIERTALQQITRLENDLLREGIALSNEETASIRQRVEANQREIEQNERRVSILNEINGPQREYNQQLQALNALMEQGLITIPQFNQQLLEARERLNESFVATDFAGGFEQQIERMRIANSNFAAQAGSDLAEVFGPNGTFQQGIAQSASRALVFGESFRESISQLSQTILTELVQALIQAAIQAAITRAALSFAGGFSTGGEVTAPQQLATGGFVSGAGGPRSDSIPAMLSNGEFVINAASTRAFRPLLERINSNPRAFQTGGFVIPSRQDVGGQRQGGQRQQAPVVQVENQAQQPPMIVNVIDREMVGDFLRSSSGRDVLINEIRTNSGAINSALGR